MRVIYRLAHGGEPPLVIGASSECSLGKNVQGFQKALTIFCTLEHIGQKQGRLLVRMAAQMQKAFSCAGI